MKDIAEPVWLYQLGDGRFPPLKTLSNTNLPAPAARFVGREREVGELGALLRDARLVTLTGPGGSGKTRLAIEVASELVRAVPCTASSGSASRPSGIRAGRPTIAQALGAQTGSRRARRRERMLLLLDNLEQVVDSAPGPWPRSPRPART